MIVMAVALILTPTSFWRRRVLSSILGSDFLSSLTEDGLSIFGLSPRDELVSFLFLILKYTVRQALSDIVGVKISLLLNRECQDRDNSLKSFERQNCLEKSAMSKCCYCRRLLRSRTLRNSRRIEGLGK